MESIVRFFAWALGALAGKKDAPAAAPTASKQTSIIATVFGGSNDINRSAYDNHIITDTEMCVALPYRFSSVRPKVKVTNIENGSSYVATIQDVGPWNVDDPYWKLGRRPQAESGTDKTGRKTNGAGIDLSPALAKAIGISGKGRVNWEFVGAPAQVPAPAKPSSSQPPWVTEALKDLGFHETGNNQGIGKFIQDAHAGQLGDPWCAISANAWLERAGVRGTRSASSQSFRHDANFMQLPGPALGAIAVYWRGSKNSGQGHVGFYLGETGTQVLTLGGNESDAVRKQFEPKVRLFGYWWPKSYPVPATNIIHVTSTDGHPTGSEV